MSVSPKMSPGPKGLIMKGAAVAPFVYFDNAPIFGLMNNVVEIDLASRVPMLQSDNSVSMEVVCIAHLRCSVEAALSLMAAIEKALDFAKKTKKAPEADYVDEEPWREPGSATQ